LRAKRNRQSGAAFAAGEFSFPVFGEVGVSGSEEEPMPIVEKQQQWITAVEQPVSIEVGGIQLKGDLIVPEEAFGLVLFATGGEMSRSGSRSRRIVRELEQQGLAVLLFSLLTPGEEDEDLRTGQLRADILLLAGRMLGVAEWAGRQAELRDFPLGFYGSGTAAAAALVASAERPHSIGAVVCRGGRADLAGSALANVQAATLLLVGASDDSLVGANESALLRLGSPRKEMIMIPDASSRFEDPRELAVVAELAADWFSQQLIQMS
jgi:putative phosphoribosyl transferase